MIVDDAEDLRTVLSLAFRRDGRLEVLASVGDGQQGVAAVRQHAPDVVLMDVSMPVMDGLTATRHLKAEFPDLPILILTGFADARLGEEAMRAGADAFMDKSESLPAVVDALVALAAGPCTSGSRGS